MNQMMKSELYTLQEIIDSFLLLYTPEMPCQKGLDADWFTKLIDSRNLTYHRYTLDASITDNDIKDYVNSLMTMVYDRHAYDIVYRYDSPATDADHDLDVFDRVAVLQKFINVINFTLPKYVPMIISYKKASADPIAPIKSESTGETKFNDTPQNVGDYGDEDHTTNISNSKSETSVDTGSLMERLSALYKDYKSIVLEWSNEFNQLFFKEEQFYE